LDDINILKWNSKIEEKEEEALKISPRTPSPTPTHVHGKYK